MKRFLVAGVSVLALTIAVQPVQSADLPVKARPIAAPVWDWTGVYFGTHSGTVHGSSNVADPFGPSIFGDRIVDTGYLAGVQLGFNKQIGPWVFGVEADVSWADVRGTNTCLAFSGTYVSANCRTKNDWFGTVTGRVGHTFGPNGSTLLYVKGGAAWTHTTADVTNNNLFFIFAPAQTSVSTVPWGWTVGAGVEQALAPAWTLRLEYDYMSFSRFNVATPSSIVVTPAGAITAFVPAGTTTVQESFHVAKLGVNYKFGVNPSATFASPTGPAASGGWEFELGGRYWFSSGRFQKDLPGGPALSTSLVSRLTYDNLTAHSGELFGRIDTPLNFFLKGMAGLGRINGGHMNDEDWGLGGPPFTSYSNTLSGLTNTGLNYFTVDAGYNFLRGPTYKVGGFVGYNYFYEQMAANDCTQIASPSSGICAPPIIGTPVITETDKWHSLRVGLAADVMLTDRLRLTAEAAYLPYVSFSGVDNHWLRALVITENGRGRGAQIEAVLSYQVTPQFSVGAGGRYWAFWTTTGSDAFNGIPVSRDDTYRAERYGGFLQASYRFDPPGAIVARY